MTAEEIARLRGLHGGGTTPVTWELSIEAVNALPGLLDEVERLRAKADQYERDWYDAKSEFGEAMAKMAAERDEARAEVERLKGLLHSEQLCAMARCDVHERSYQEPEHGPRGCPWCADDAARAEVERLREREDLLRRVQEQRAHMAAEMERLRAERDEARREAEASQDEATRQRDQRMRAMSVAWARTDMLMKFATSIRDNYVHDDHDKRCRACDAEAVIERVITLRAEGVVDADSATRGARAERAAIVAWLRERHGPLDLTDGIADAIERGEHER